MAFQPTLPARGATDRFAQHCIQQLYFNPRSPHGERRESQLPGGIITYFNPRSPHGERQPTEHPEVRTKLISTHAPRTGSDPFLLSYQ